jgi:hypothetical protein
MKNIKLFEEFADIQKWKIYAGLGGGFGGPNKIQPLRRYITDIIYKGNNPLVQQKINEYLGKEKQDEISRIKSILYENKIERDVHEPFEDSKFADDDGNFFSVKSIYDFVESNPEHIVKVEKNMINNINDIIKDYISQTEYDIENSLGNCSFFARDVINWVRKNGIKADYVYMPMSKEYRSKHKIGKDFGGNDSDWEDHIVPMVNGVIIDFTYTPRGVSKYVRTANTIPPKLFKYSKSLFEPNGVYGKLGYTEPEINTEYGNSKNINSFDIQEPNKKKSESLDETEKITYKAKF